MSAVARSIRPFASRALAQKPLASACRAAPASRFPRGTRSFSQSPLGELPCPSSWPCGRNVLFIKEMDPLWPLVDRIELHEVIETDGAFNWHL